MNIYIDYFIGCNYKYIKHLILLFTIAKLPLAVAVYTTINSADSNTDVLISVQSAQNAVLINSGVQYAGSIIISSSNSHNYNGDPLSFPEPYFLTYYGGIGLSNKGNIISYPRGGNNSGIFYFDSSPIVGDIVIYNTGTINRSIFNRSNFSEITMGANNTGNFSIWNVNGQINGDIPFDDESYGYNLGILSLQICGNSTISGKIIGTNKDQGTPPFNNLSIGHTHLSASPASYTTGGLIKRMQLINVYYTTTPNYFTIVHPITENINFNTLSGTVTNINANGSLSSNILDNNGTLNINANGILSDATRITNRNTGVINVMGNVSLSEMSTIINNGAINVKDKGNFSGALTIYNYVNGNINIIGNASLRTGSTLNNYATINVNDKGTLSNIETLTNLSNGVINIIGKTNLTADGTLNNYATIDINSQGELAGAGIFNNNYPGIINISGNLNLPEGSVTNNDYVVNLNDNGDLIIKGTINNNHDNGIINIVGNASLLNTNNSGTININDKGVLYDTQHILNNSNGIVNVYKNGDLSGVGSLTNNGQLNINEGGEIGKNEKFNIIDNNNIMVIDGKVNTKTLNNYDPGIIDINNQVTVSNGVTNTGYLKVLSLGEIKSPFARSNSIVLNNGNLSSIGRLYIAGKVPIPIKMKNTNSTINLENGCEFLSIDGSVAKLGIVNINSDLEINNNNLIKNIKNFYVNDGYLVAIARLVSTDSFTVEQGATIDINPNGNIVVSTTSNNNGTINVNANGTLSRSIASNSGLLNNGVLSISGNILLPIINNSNYAIVNVNDGAKFLSINGDAINKYGIVNVDNTSLNIRNAANSIDNIEFLNIKNQSNITIAKSISTKNIETDESTITNINPSGTISIGVNGINYGTIDIKSKGTLLVTEPAILHNHGTINSGGVLAIEGAVTPPLDPNVYDLKNYGIINVSGNVTGTGIIHNDAAGIINIENNGNLSGERSLTNYGMLTVNSGGEIGKTIVLSEIKNLGMASMNIDGKTQVVTLITAPDSSIVISNLLSIGNANTILDIYKTINRGSLIINANGILSKQGVFQNYNNASLIINDGGILSVTNQFINCVSSNLTINSNGTLNVDGDDVINSGTMNISGIIKKAEILTNSDEHSVLNIEPNAKILMPIVANIAGPTINISGGQFKSIDGGQATKYGTVNINAETFSINSKVNSIFNINNLNIKEIVDPEILNKNIVNVSMSILSNNFNTDEKTITNINSNGNLDIATLVANYGIININANGTLSGIGEITNNASGIININANGDLSGERVLTNYGKIAIINGEIGKTASLTNINNNLTMNIGGKIKAAAINNAATGIMTVNNSIIITAGNAIANSGILRFLSNGAVNVLDSLSATQIDDVKLNNSGKLYVNGKISIPIELNDVDAEVTINGGEFRRVTGYTNIFGGNLTCYNNVNINILDNEKFELITDDVQYNAITNFKTYNVQGNSIVTISNKDANIFINKSFNIDPFARLVLSNNVKFTGSGDGTINNSGIIDVLDTSSIGESGDDSTLYNNAFENSKGAITNKGTINIDGAMYIGKLTNDKIGKVNLNGNIVAMPVDVDGNVTEGGSFISNYGIINVGVNGRFKANNLPNLLDPQLNMLHIVNSGKIVSFGKIDIPIHFADDGGEIVVKSGTINSVLGNDVTKKGVVIFDIINDTKFILDQNTIISNVKNFNITGNSHIGIIPNSDALSDVVVQAKTLFVGSNAILDLQSQGAHTTTFNVNKIYNNGKINLGTVGATEKANLGDSENLFLDDIDNNGFINGADKGVIYAKNIINHKNCKIISNYDFKVIANVINYGNIRFNDSANVDVIEPSNFGRVINYGEITSSGIINLPIEFKGGGGVVNISSSVNNNFTTIIGNNEDNAEDTVNFLDVTKNEIGDFNIDNGKKLINIKNLNIYSVKRALNIATKNLIRKNINIGLGSALSIKDGGDLSGGADINNLGIMTVENGGTIGDTYIMGNIINSNDFVANGAVKISKFENNSINSNLIVNSNFASIGVYNNFGVINIGDGSAGDLSSLDYINLANLFNAKEQHIRINSTGSLGQVKALGDLDNQGIITVKGRVFNIKSLTNRATGNINFNFGNPVTSIGEHDLKINGNLINYGIIKLNNGSIYAEKIINFGKLLSGGTINSSIEFAKNSELVILGGKVNDIIGNNGEEMLNFNLPYTCDKNAPFIIDHQITNVDSININRAIADKVLDPGNSDVTMQITNSIFGINKEFNIKSNFVVVNINGGGVISGTGILRNLGAMFFHKDPAVSDSMGWGKLDHRGKVINYNLIEINTDNRIKHNVGELINEYSSVLKLKKCDLFINLDGSSTITNKGTITIGDAADPLSSAKINSKILNTTLLNSGEFSLVGGGSMMVEYGKLASINNTGNINIDNQDGLNIYGDFINNDINESNSLDFGTSLKIKKGNVNIGNIKNIRGIIEIGENSSSVLNADLSSIDHNIPSIIENYKQQTISVIKYGTIGNISFPIEEVNNKGFFNLTSEKDKTGIISKINKFYNNDINAVLTINASTLSYILFGNIYNNLGSIKIYQGDISSLDYNSRCNFFNGEDQKIDITGTATIGKYITNSISYSIGDIYNKGIINANGGNWKITGFINNNTDAKLNISNGIFSTGNLYNVEGVVNILGTAVSSGGTLSIIDYGIISNKLGQIINVNNYGRITADNPSNVIINEGVVNLAGIGIVTEFNNVCGSALNIVGGHLQIENITNEQGKILIGDLNAGGDLSSMLNASIVRDATLTNNVGQEIAILGNGTIGAEVDKKFIKINNYGVINAEGSDINIAGLENNAVPASVNINYGLFNSYANIYNKLGKININGMNNSSLNMKANIVGTDQYDESNRIIYNSGIIDVSANNKTNNNNLINCTYLNNEINGIINLGGNISLLRLNNHGGVIMTRSSTINKFTGNDGVLIENSGNYQVYSNATHVLTFSNNLPNVLDVNGNCNLHDGSNIIIATPIDVILNPANYITIIHADTLTVGASYVEANNTNLKNVNLITNNSIMNFQLVTQQVNNRRLLQAKGSYVTTEVSRELPSGLYNIIGNSLENLGIIFANNESRIMNVARNELSSKFNLPLSASGYNAGDGMQLAASGYNAGGGMQLAASGYNAGGGMQSKGNIWFKGIVEHNKQQSVNTLQHHIEGYTSNSKGFTLGTDREILHNFLTGVSVSLVRTRMSNKLFSKHNKINSYQSTLYASYSTSKNYLDLLFNLGFSRNFNVRYINAINNMPAYSKFNILLPAVKIASGYIYQLRDWRLIPNICLRYSKLYQFSYQETGIGGFGLKFARNSFIQLEGGLGLRLSYYNLSSEQLIFNPSIYGMIIRDLYIKSRAGKVEFIGGGDLGITVIGFNKFTYNLGVELNIIKSQKLDLIANYNIKFNAKFLGHQANLLVKYKI